MKPYIKDGMIILPPGTTASDLLEILDTLEREEPFAFINAEVELLRRDFA